MMEVGTRFRVLRRLPPSSRVTQPPLMLAPGTLVTIGERSSEWPAFVLVASPTGATGWVPERLLERVGETRVAKENYDTTTLDPAPGEVLTGLDEDRDAGWIWCERKPGEAGWFPVSYLEEL
ncbi:MAG: SH3 domain-containing protein [Thermoplasmata archaeon]